MGRANTGEDHGLGGKVGLGPAGRKGNEETTFYFVGS